MTPTFREGIATAKAQSVHKGCKPSLLVAEITALDATDHGPAAIA